MQCLFPIFCTLLNRADDKCIFKRHIFAFWVDLDIIAEIGFVAQGILKCARTSSLTSTTLKTTLTEVQYYLGLHRQHRRQRWEKRPFEISGSLIFGSLWESNLKCDKKITLGFWWSGVPLHKVELNETRHNAPKTCMSNL